jgi:hypothetical protein
VKPLRRLERDLYLAARTTGDIAAAQRGPGVLAQRVARRVIRRSLFQLIRRAR